MTSKDKFFSNKLLEWYEKNQRELPWRKNIRHKDYPYRVLVSEFMLQQTTVATVCLLYTSPSPRDRQKSRLPSSA